MKTFFKFITEAPTEAQAAQMAPGMSPEKRRAALERNARRQAARDTPVNQGKQKALPAGQQGGSMEKRPGSSLVKQQDSNNSLVKKPGGGLVKTAGQSTALAKRGSVTPTDPKKTTMSKSTDDKRDVGTRTEMPKSQTPEKEEKPSRYQQIKNKFKDKKDQFSKTSVGGITKDLGTAGKKFGNFYRKNVRTGSTGAKGGSDVQSGKGTTKDRR